MWDSLTCLGFCSSRVKLRRRVTKLAIGSSREKCFKADSPPSQMKSLIHHLVQTAVVNKEIFRRPGNYVQIQDIIRNLKQGREIVDWNHFSAYTLANVIKRYMLCIPGGLLGEAAGLELIATLEMDESQRIQEMHTILLKQPQFVLEFLSLILGIWFLIVYNQPAAVELDHSIKITALSRAVAGSLFPHLSYKPEDIELAVRVTEHLITNFPNKQLLGAKWIQYFTEACHVCIVRIEKHAIEMHFPAYFTNEKCQIVMEEQIFDLSGKYGFDAVECEVTQEEYENFSYSLNNHDSAPMMTCQLIEFGTHVNVEDNAELTVIKHPEFIGTNDGKSMQAGVGPVLSCHANKYTVDLRHNSMKPLESTMRQNRESDLRVPGLDGVKKVSNRWFIQIEKYGSMSPVHFHLQSDL